MKILVAGADGQLGRCLVDKARDDKLIDLVALNRSILDISDISSIQNAVNQHRPNYVINTAAYTAVDLAETETEKAYLVNQKGPENLAKVCSDMDIPLVHVSTDYVFDGSSQVPYLETDTTCPKSVYGASKLAGELAVEKWQKHIIVRTAWVFSEYGNNFVKTMLRLGELRDQLSVVDDQIGCPTYAADIANALISICRSNSHKWGVYNYVGADQMSWYDFARHIFAKALELNILTKMVQVDAIPSSDYPTPAVRPAYSVLNTEKIVHEYNVQPQFLDSALDRTLQKTLKK